jgi:hypothetical protein
MPFTLNQERMQTLVSEMAGFLANHRNIDEHDTKAKKLIENLQPILSACRKRAIDRAISCLEHLKKADPDHPVFEEISLLAPMQRETWEVHHTRILAWLLNPSNPHGFGQSMLLRLISEMLPKQGRQVSIEYLDQIAILPEYICHNRYRIDIWGECRLYNKSGCIPLLIALEAKIHSEEQKKQLSNYDKAILCWQSSNKNGVVLRIFLTPDARQVCSSDEKWIPMEYLDLARILWSVGKDKQEAPAYMYLRYYIAGIYKDIYGWTTPPNANRQPYELLHSFRESNGVLRVGNIV